MLIFNCTKAASDFFTVTRKGERISPIDPSPCKLMADDVDYLKGNDGSTPKEISEWLVHVIRVQRKPIVFAIEKDTRYVMTFVDLKKGEYQRFLTDFIERIANLVQYFGEDLMIMNDDTFEPMLNNFLAVNSEYRFFSRSDRSMQSHINEIAWFFKDTAENSGCLPDTEQVMCFDADMNSMLRQYKGLKDMIYPANQMLFHWLRNYCDYDEKQIKDVSERIRELKRAMSGAPMSIEMGTDHEEWDMENQPGSIPDNVIVFPTKR
ncbi:DUF6933 domain-containing protein [Vibrio zhugei]|uniref:DUF6933 domain-containing protein n=1 Tax=Vibrio zhugei TaxID=2479546 RepID=A0ABV7CCP7_9VIBR|nr:hypothetical protein [Vibrio zhugei]